jgi:hypothetical protein
MRLYANKVAFFCLFGRKVVPLRSIIQKVEIRKLLNSKIIK